ncbi:MAG: RNA polymerase sigma factor [Gemmataceae bacterium]
MPETFEELVKRLRLGDPEAARTLVRTYEGEIRRAIRVRLTDPALRRSLDSVDVCQSVLANFFFRVSAGQFDLHRPEQLLALLIKMARNKVIDHARKAHARQAGHRVVGDDAQDLLATAADPQETPSGLAANRDLVAAVRRRLTPDERYLAEQRAAGREWSDLAAELGRSADALRKQHDRALDRVAEQLGLDSSEGL